MTLFCKYAGIAPNLLLAVFLIAAQSIVSTHGFEHDTVSTQNQVCTTCVAASQLASSAVDGGSAYAQKTFLSVLNAAVNTAHRSIRAPAARQRGPPSSP